MAPTGPNRSKRILLIGNPNVGKSVVFRLLTGSYVLVSNFPGTTVEIFRGRMQLAGTTYEVIDTPGVYSLVPQSEDERVTCAILLQERPDIVLQVADAKNLRRTLLLTSQLAELGLPMVLVLNMIDEAEARGIKTDSQGISELFGISVIETIAIHSQGKKPLLQAILSATTPKNPLRAEPPLVTAFPLQDKGIEGPVALAVEWLALDDRNVMRELERPLGTSFFLRVQQAQEAYRTLYHRSLASAIADLRSEFLDGAAANLKSKREPRYIDHPGSMTEWVWLGLLFSGLLLFAWNEVGGLLNVSTPLSLLNRLIHVRFAEPLAEGTSGPWTGLLVNVLFGKSPIGRFEYGLVPELAHLLLVLAPVIIPFAVLLAKSRSFTREMGILARRASTGIPILLVVVLLMYEFVGYTGAQTLVGLLEKIVFGQYLIPLMRALLRGGLFSDFLAGKYGMVSMGLTYAIAIVLPVIGTFFIAFGLLEDSGYLPRLSILSDKVMRLMGLNGKATLPMVLGLGCCTMATITTRILNSRKERLIATILLALGIPCSAQLGVMLGIASGFSLKATLFVIAVVASQLLLVGFLSSKLFRGRPTEFIVEVPPIRVPQLKNVMLKTACRVRWYLVEAVPLFLYGTGVLFLLDKLLVNGRSLLEWLEYALAPVLTGILNLPSSAAGVFVLGFLRRDYGAAGLYGMVRNGLLTGQQVVVSLVVITLFVPCIASFFVIIREHGLKQALAIAGFILALSISVGGIVSWFLRAFNIDFA